MGAVGRPVESRNWWRLSFVILSPLPLLARTWCSETLWPAPEGGPAHLGRYPEVRGAPCRNGPAPCGPPGSCSSSSACRSASWRPSGPWPMPGSTSSRSGSSGNPGLRTSSRASVVSSGSLRLSDTSCTGRVGTRDTGQGPSPSERPHATPPVAAPSLPTTTDRLTQKGREQRVTTTLAPDPALRQLTPAGLVSLPV